MMQNRSSSKHNRRRTIGLLVTCGVLALAFATDRGAPNRGQHGAQRLEMAMAGGGGSLGGGHGGGYGHWRGGVIGGGSVGQNGTDGRMFGPGEGDKDSWSGFMPNGEDGLMSFADFVHGGDGGSNPNQGGQYGGHPDDFTGHGPNGFNGYSGGGGPGGGGGGFGKPNGGDGGNGGNGGSGGNGGNGGNGGSGGNGGNGGGKPGDPDGPGGGFGGPGDGGGDPCFVNCGHEHPPGFTPEGPGDTPLTSAVPEPAAWTLMILGFGGLGSVLRAQRKARRILA